MNNNFKIIIRHLLRDKSYLLVNMLSLSVGLLCCLFIFKYVQQEWSYDKFHENADRISRIGLNVYSDDGTSSQYAYLGTSPINWLNEIPEIKKQTRFATLNWDMNVDVRGENFTENGIISADSSFFSLFSFKLLQGDPTAVLEKPNSVVLTKSIAQKYFGSENILGETISIGFRDAEARLTVTGIVENTPSNSHFSFDIVTSADAYKKLNGVSLQNYSNTYCYVKTTQNATTDQLEKKLNALYKQNLPEAASVSQFFAQPITEIHLHSSANGELSTNSNATYV